jgi:pimeloyl-ACP methyl ester carboxylesterase
MDVRSGTARCGAVELFYEDLGDVDAPPVLLIMGVGAQLPMWPDGFCELLVAKGFRVIRFDHRDTGLSTKMHGQRAVGSVLPRIGRYLLGKPSPVPYTLVDLAEDAKNLLDDLEIDSAHVVGASMGGMIAQILAGSNPDRVASLGLLMTSSGKPLSALPRWRVIRLAINPPGKHAPRAARVAYEVHNIAVINGPNFLPTHEQLRHRVETLTARSDYPQGGLRQFDAILGTGSLLRFTRRITAPTVVVHGSVDPMVRLRNGRNLARLIVGSRFVVVEGMGHDLPAAVWRPVVDALVENLAAKHQLDGMVDDGIQVGAEGAVQPLLG